jgi:hypothetical protein
MFGAFVGAGALLVSPMLAQPAGGAEKQGTWWKFASLGIKFEGADTCGGSNCHGGGNTNYPPEKEGSPGSQYNIWQANDKHANAAKQITEPDLEKQPWMKDIGAKLGITGPLLSDAKCVSCHATQLPANLQGKSFNVNEGVTCYHCHGPSEKWKTPHAEKGWTQKQRDGKSHDALLKEWGLYDTKSVMHRAQMCASCHLSIDASLVKAGHPQPIFEQVTFQTNEPQHWVDPTGYYVSKLWAAGQVIALRDAMQQLATRATGGAEEAYVKQAHDQAMTHLAMVDAILAAKLIDGDKAALDAAAKPLAAKPDAAAAAAVAKLAEALSAKINDAQPDKAKTLAVLTAVSGNADLVKTHGRRAAEQQYYAIYNLYAAAYASAEGVGEADYKKVDDLIAPLAEQVPLEDKTKEVDAAKFTADLAKAAEALKGLK